MYDPIENYYLNPKIKYCLIVYGINTAQDVLNLSRTELKKITRLNERDVESIYETIKTHPKNLSCLYLGNALNYLDLISQKIPISTFTDSIDDLLDGGFQTGKLYQIYGESGVGKTQFSLQLCSTVQILRVFGGEDASAVYIDSENSFKSERYIEICRGTLNKISDKDKKKYDLNVDTMLNNLFYCRCTKVNELTNLLLYKLEDFIKTRKKLPKLVIVDSIAYLFRYGFDDLSLWKFNLISKISQKLKEIAFKFDICVICINQVSCDLENDDTIPALGIFWNHEPTSFLRMIKLDNNLKCCKIEKKFNKKEYGFFMIDKNGLVNPDNINEEELINEIKRKNL